MVFACCFRDLLFFRVLLHWVLHSNGSWMWASKVPVNFLIVLFPWIFYCIWKSTWNWSGSVQVSCQNSAQLSSYIHSQIWGGGGGWKRKLDINRYWPEPCVFSCWLTRACYFSRTFQFSLSNSKVQRKSYNRMLSFSHGVLWGLRMDMPCYIIKPKPLGFIETSINAHFRALKTEL